MFCIVSCVGLPGSKSSASQGTKGAGSPGSPSGMVSEPSPVISTESPTSLPGSSGNSPSSGVSSAHSPVTPPHAQNTRSVASKLSLDPHVRLRIEKLQVVSSVLEPLFDALMPCYLSSLFSFTLPICMVYCNYQVSK